MKNEYITDRFLEEIANPKVKEWLAEQTEPYRTLMAYYRCAIMEIETKFNVLNEEFSIRYDRNPIEGIKTRLKSPEGVFEKLKRKGLPLSIQAVEENIFDVAGIRIICSFPEDIYMLASCLEKQDDITIITKKDYIKNPKENGYRSLHLIVEVPIYLANKKKPMKAEVQLRTIAMDFWASLEHKLRYKKDIEETEYISNELRECAELSAQLDLRMEAVRKFVNTKD